MQQCGDIGNPAGRQECEHTKRSQRPFANLARSSFATALSSFDRLLCCAWPIAHTSTSRPGNQQEENNFILSKDWRWLRVLACTGEHIPAGWSLDLPDFSTSDTLVHGSPSRHPLLCLLEYSAFILCREERVPVCSFLNICMMTDSVRLLHGF